MRPSPIVHFERLLFGALAIDLVNNLVHWSALGERVSTSGAVASPLLLLMMSLASPLVGLGFWYFVVRRRSSVAKWLLTAVVVIGAAALAVKLAQTDGADVNALLLVACLAELLKLVAVSRLHTRGGSAWFGGQEGIPAKG